MMEKIEQLPGEQMMILESVGQNHKGTKNHEQILNFPDLLGEVS